MREPGSSVAQDLEPEYVAVSSDSSTAWVSLQENNALAVVDLDNAQVTDLVALGFKDHSMAGAGLEPSDADGVIAIDTWPVWGMYQPDALARFTTTRPATSAATRRWARPATSGPRASNSCPPPIARMMSRC